MLCSDVDGSEAISISSEHSTTGCRLKLLASFADDKRSRDFDIFFSRRRFDVLILMTEREINSKQPFFA